MVSARARAMASTRSRDRAWVRVRGSGRTKSSPVLWLIFG
jgi:hypothetical protein